MCLAAEMLQGELSIIFVSMILLMARIISCEVYYIIPSLHDGNCHMDSCLTLSQLASKLSNLIDSNETLMFAEGNHSLDQNFTAVDITALSLVTVNNTNSSSIINCQRGAKFNFSSIGHIYISKITFMGCQNNIFEYVNKLVIEDSVFIGIDTHQASSPLPNHQDLDDNIAMISSQLDLSNTEFLRYMNNITTTSMNSNDGIKLGGALIITECFTKLHRCTFQSNSANIGGAIFSGPGSDITISESHFASNHAEKCNNKVCLGGALFLAQTGTVTVYNSTFHNNTSNQDGGTIVALNANFSVSHCKIHNNMAFRFGGAIAVFQNSTLFIEVTNVSGNGVYLLGGALYMSASRFLVVNSTFVHNTASSGGAMYASNSCKLRIYSTIFQHNEVHFNGGVAFLSRNSTLSISSSRFDYNYCGHNGGVISADNQILIDVINSNFSFNNATNFGGVFHTTKGCNVTVSNSSFDLNSAGFEGGVFDGFNKSTILVYRSTFTNNTSGINGGVCEVRIGSTFSANHSLFINNSCHDDGAVVYSYKGNNISFDQCRFVHNIADSGGVLMSLGNSVVAINSSTFRNNTAKSNGATVFVHTNSSVIIRDSLILSNKAINDGVVYASTFSNVSFTGNNVTDNEADHDGGVVYVYDHSLFKVSNCNFISNWAFDSGGSLYARKFSNMTINNSTFHNSSSEVAGGVVFAQQQSNVTIQDSKFTLNSADYGGVVFLYTKSEVAIRNSNFIENKGSIHGGIIAAYKNSKVNALSSNFTSNRAGYGGVVLLYNNSFLTFENNNFFNHSANTGGIIRALPHSNISISNSTFRQSSAIQGAIIDVLNSTNISVNASYFSNNRVTLDGGVIYAITSRVVVKHSSFESNRAEYDGGIVSADNSTIESYNNTFTNNTVGEDGGVICMIRDSAVSIEYSAFMNNSAGKSGGVFCLQESLLNVFNSSFTLSKAEQYGGVSTQQESNVNIYYSTFIRNRANSGGVLALNSLSTLQVTVRNFSQNTAALNGGVFSLDSNSSANITSSNFTNNSAQVCGGVVLITKNSGLLVRGSSFSSNQAGSGGALAANKESYIIFESKTHLLKNKATSGGGVYLSNSLIQFKATTIMKQNTAQDYGGGIQAINSSIAIQSTVYFDGNQAREGGALSLKHSFIYDIIVADQLKVHDVCFSSNFADFGGGIFVDDGGQESACSSEDCFFKNVSNNLNFKFYNNSASKSGGNLYGGLLDRCTYAKTNKTDQRVVQVKSAKDRFMEITNITESDNKSISSQPVRVCYCENDMHRPSCGQDSHSIKAKSGNIFEIEVAAVDQVGNIVSATIESSLGGLLLPAYQLRKVGANCSQLNYSATFPDENQHYNLTMFAKGVCDGKGVSSLTVNITVLKCLCAPGFMQEPQKRSCSCVCHKDDTNFHKYIKECNSSTQTVIRKGTFWITYLNNSVTQNSTSSYFIYPYCPLDYCKPPSKSININLGLPNGPDVQCENNRGGLLCGRCLSNYSLSLGSSTCIQCPDHWHGRSIGIVIAAIFAGISLVLLILLFNLTIAVGTLNAIIFYANIIYANKSIYFGQPHLTFVSIVVSWLNLDIGFDTCFFKGMDTFAKTWIQLAFPAYVILLVFIIIAVSSYSSKFSQLIGKRDPVATLATLILLSYVRLLQTVITCLSAVSLEFPNGTTSKRWLPDASVKYFKGKHIALVCMAILILLFGLFYTIIIFSKQWLVHCPRSKLYKTIRLYKLQFFIDTYHMPYTAKHRYWTGLLLFIRIVVYLISALSISSDPRITLLSTVIIISLLFLYLTACRIVRVYKNSLISALESFVYFNIVCFALVTWYSSNNQNNNLEIVRNVFINISVSTIFLLFLVVVTYHAYRYTNTKFYSTTQSTKFIKKIKERFSRDDSEVYQSSLDAANYHLFGIMDGFRESRDYSPPSSGNLHQGPTRSTVSLSDSNMSSVPEEAL